MSTADAGRKRWQGISKRERSEMGKSMARQREERRARLRAAATFALEALEGMYATDEGGERMRLEAIPRLKEALAT